MFSQVSVYFANQTLPHKLRMIDKAPRIFSGYVNGKKLELVFEVRSEKTLMIHRVLEASFCASMCRED